VSAEALRDAVGAAGPSSSSVLALAGSYCSQLNRQRAIPDWLVTTTTGQPAAAAA
jgi:hypothetical protein